MIYPDYIPDPIRREPMPKTVTVEVEIPDGYELAEPRVRYAELGDYVPAGREPRKWSESNRSLYQYPILRPIPTEKTWERPEWLIADYVTHDDRDGWYAWLDSKPVCNDGVWDVPISPGKSSRRFYLSRWFIDEGSLPTIVGPPAERIWRIVERGQG